VDRERQTPLENAEAAVRRAEEEFNRSPNDANDAKVRDARNFVRSLKEFAAKHPDFNRRPES
jgi:Tfp pilus assembly protein PilX